MKKKRIFRSKTDVKLNAMSRLIEKYRWAYSRKNKYNEQVRRPIIAFLALTEIEDYGDYGTASYGAITEHHRKMTDATTTVYCEMRVGRLDEDRLKGTGLNYKAASSALKSGKGLEHIANSLIKDLWRESKENYGTLLTRSENYKIEEYVLQQLKSVEIIQDIQKCKRGNQHNVKNLHKIIKNCSEIFIKKCNDKKRFKKSPMINNQVKLKVYDAIRRYVNSEGTVIKDHFYGLYIKFFLEIQDLEGIRWPMYHTFYFTDPKEITESKMIYRAHKFADMVLERFDCQAIPPYHGPVLTEPYITSGLFHEALAHTITSDVVLDEKSTVLGLKSFNQKVAPKELSIFSDPNMNPGGWGSYQYDQEGVKTKRVPLIKDGIHIGYLANRHGAEVLSQRLGIDIPAGSSLTNTNNDEKDYDIFIPQPRINILDVIWKRKKYNNQELKNKFIEILEERGLKEGLYIKNFGSPGYYGDKSSHLDFWAPYLMDSRGNLKPVKPVEVANHPRKILGNLVAMSKSKEYNPHRCGDNEDMAEIRTNIKCGAAIFDNLNVDPVEKEKYESFVK